MKGVGGCLIGSCKLVGLPPTDITSPWPLSKGDDKGKEDKTPW